MYDTELFEKSGKETYYFLCEENEKLKQENIFLKNQLREINEYCEKVLKCIN